MILAGGGPGSGGRDGYFSVPRETTLDDIADELAIRHRAAPGRVRRCAEKTLRKAPLGLTAADFEPDGGDRT